MSPRRRATLHGLFTTFHRRSRGTRSREAPGGRGRERGPPGDRALRSAQLDEEVGREPDVGREGLGVVVRERVPRSRGEPPDGVRTKLPPDAV